MRRRFLKVLGLGCIAAAMGACWGNSTYAYHQKLTVVVDTPDGERSGSAVTEVTANVGSQGYLSAAIIGYKVRGEATAVDLGNGKYLFALLSSGGDYLATEYWAMNAFYKRVMAEYPSGSEERLHAFYTALRTMRGSERLTSDAYPLLVTFTDINDPKTVKEVKPGSFADVFGVEYSLRSISLEIVDQEATISKVSELLPWVNRIEGRIKPTDKKFENELLPTEKLYSNSFITENL